MSASWDSDLSSIIEKTNNNLKLLRKIGDKPQVRAPDVSVTAAPSLRRTGSASGSVSSHSSARPRAYVGAQDDAGSSSSRSSARPRAFVRGDDDTSSMGSRGSVRPKAFVRGDDDSGSMGSHSPARPRVYVGDDGTGSVSSHASARPKAFVRVDDDSGSVSSRASARPKAFIRPDDDSGSVSSRASARPKAFIRGDDDTGSMSSRSSARPRAFVRGDDDSGSMSSNQGLGRSRLDSGHGSSASTSSRPHVGIAGGGGLTAAMLQQHRATAGGPGGLAMGDLGAPRPRYDLDETRSMTGSVSSRLNRRVGANGRVPHARPLGASMGPRIRVPDADIPSDVPNHMVEEVKKSLETQFASRSGAVDKKVADLRTDVAGLTTQTSALSSQITELRNAVLVSTSSNVAANAPSVSDPKLIATVQANAAAIARLEEHSADLLGRKVSVDRELVEMATRVKSLSSATTKIPTLEDNIEALVANRQKQEQGLFKLADRVQLMHRQMGSLVDMKAVENLLSIRLTREFREMEDRLSQNVIRMAEKMEQKVQSLEKQSFSQRQESLAALKNDLSDDIQRLQSSALRKSDLLPLQNAQTQSKEDLAQLSSALDRQEKKLQDAKVASATLRDELADARTELNKALQSQQRSAAAVMEEKLEQIASSSKEKTNKFDDQLSELAKKQKKLEEATKTLQETMSQVKAEANQGLSRSSTDRDEENDKLRQRLARSVAELEALATTKAEVERRFASEEQQFQTRLKELRSNLTETEKQKEAQRLELMQKLQEESKLMGVAQGKNSLLENLLAREKAENEEKNEVVRKSKKEVAEVREQIRNLESEKEKKVRQLTSELQAKQTQVGLLTKTLKRIETASAKMLDLSKREAKTVRRVKATKEHELFIAQLKLKEMERVAQALQNGDEMKKQAALTAASTEERNELEKLLLESQLEKDELKQELEEMTEEFNAAKESQKQIMEDTITKLSSDYDDKIGELKQQISDKEQAMRQLRDTLVEKSNLDALEDELSALKDEKNDLLEQIQRAQIEHERVTLKTETNLRLEHATEFGAMKSKFEERLSELEGARSELEATKATISELEKELEKQEALHQRELSTLTHEIKEARGKIDELTAQILDLQEAKARLEGEVSQMEANIGGASAEREEELAAIKSRMQSEVDRLRAELAEVSSNLEEKQTSLKEAKQSDETNRQRLVEMAMAQEEMQSRYISQIDSLTLKLNQERESSRSREQDLEDTIDKLNADVKSLKAESSKDLENVRLELTEQMSELTTTLKASQHREQQLQSRLKRILEELVQAANASGENEVAENADAEMSDDEAIIHHLDALYATHRRTAHELDRLQAEYELTVKQAAADSATAQELDNQVKEHETQIRELESVVEQLREELKEQYHKSAIIAKGSDEFSDEMANLREEKRQLERQLQEEEKDRAKREVSYQRRTEMKEREVEELRTENKTLTAAVAAVREKIRAVENVKYHDLSELQNKLSDLEERTAALQPDENNVANLEKDFTATRHEIVTLTAEVQSLYQKLTACCGILEWTELRASVFDEEEKLTRVRSESARELAKVQSVEQEVLMNAEFLNALLVAHGSMGGNENLLNDFRWMQKYASIAPEIVEKLRKVETRLRDAVLDLHGDSSSLFPDSVTQSLVSNEKSDEVVTQPPNSQNSAVDGAAIALALEKAKDDYFSEASDAGQDDELNDAEVEKSDMDQPDVENEGEELEIPEGAGANSDNVDVDGQDSIGELSHDESEACDELVVAEHVVRDEQENSHELQEAASLEMSNLDKDEDSSVDVAEDSFKSEQDRIDDDVDGPVSGVDRKIEMTKILSKLNSVGTSGGDEDDDMDEVERLKLDRSLAHSPSKQVKPHIDNECDDSDEFAASFVPNETEEKQSVITNAAELAEESVDEEDVGEESIEDPRMVAPENLRDIDLDASAEDAEQGELSESEQDGRSDDEEEELDPLEESSFDNAMMSALESKEALTANDEEQADSEADAVHNAIERSLDESMVSETDTEAMKSQSPDNLEAHHTSFDAEDDSGRGKLLRVIQNLHVEDSVDEDAVSDSEQSADTFRDPTPAQSGGVVDENSTLEESLSSEVAGDQRDDNDENVLEESAENTSQHSEGNEVDESSPSLARGTISDQQSDDNELEESSSSIASGESANYSGEATYQLARLEASITLEESASSDLNRRSGEDNSLEELAASTRSGVLADQHYENDVLEESSSSKASRADEVGVNVVNALVQSTSSTGSGELADQLDEHDVLEEPSSLKARRFDEDGTDDFNVWEESASSTRSEELVDQHPPAMESALRTEDDALEESSLSKASDEGAFNDVNVSVSSTQSEALADAYHEVDALAKSSSSKAISSDEDDIDDVNALEESVSSTRSGALVDQLYDVHGIEESSSIKENMDFDDINALDALGSSTGDAIEDQPYKGDTLTQLSSRITKGVPMEYGDDVLEESASSVKNIRDQLYNEDNALDESSSLDNGAQVFEDRALEESCSSIASSEYEMVSPDRTSSRILYGGGMETGDVEIHDHVETSSAIISHSDAESSFDADSMLDRPGVSVEVDLSSHPGKNPEEEDDEWSEDQLREAEQSLERVITEDDGNDGDITMEATHTMSLRMEEDESSQEEEEEETMPVTTLPTFEVSLNRLGMGRRHMLEEDDEMDEVERLLLQQSSSSARQQQPPISRFTRPLSDSDDEFGEITLLSHGLPEDGDVEEVEHLRNTSRRTPNINRFIKPLADDDDEFGESSLQSNGDDEGELGQMSNRSRVDDDFGEESIRSRDDKLNEDSVGLEGRRGDDEFGEDSIHSYEDSMRRSTGQGSGLNKTSFLLHHEKVGEGSLGSRSLAGESLTQLRSHEFEDHPTGSKSHVEDELGEVSIQSYEDKTFVSASVLSGSREKHKFENVSAYTSAHEQNEFRESLHSISHIKDNFGKTFTQPKAYGQDEFGEASIGSKSHEDDEFGETSLRSQEDEFGEVSLPLDDEDASAPPLRSHGKLDITRASDYAVRTTTPRADSPSPSRPTGFNSATPIAVQDDSASEAEQDYLDESFDLDESMEEEDDDERHV